MERSSGEIEDTSEAVRSQHVLESTLSPSTCQIRLTCRDVSPIPKPPVSPQKTSAPLEVPPPKELREMTCPKKPESSSQTGKVPEQYAPPKPVDCPVTQSGRMSRPPSYPKDFVFAK